MFWFVWQKIFQVLDQPNRAVIMVPNLKWRWMLSTQAKTCYTPTNFFAWPNGTVATNFFPPTQIMRFHRIFVSIFYWLQKCSNKCSKRISKNDIKIYLKQQTLYWSPISEIFSPVLKLQLSFESNLERRLTSKAVQC